MKKTILRLALCCLGTCSSLTVLADSVYQIHPIPHQQQAVGGTTKIPAGKIQVICGDHIDSYTKARLKNILSEHNLISDSDEIFVTAPSEGFVHIFVGVNNSGDKADAKATALKLSRDVFALQNKYDKHLLSLQDAGGLAEIVILGENTDAAFIGMASLEQILDYNAPESIPCGIIYDYADQKNRGLVEGYYGVPYSIDVKKDVMRFMMRHKMNSYMYGAKSDYYHSAYWKQPYPATITEQQKNLGYLSQDMVRDLTQVSHETKVNFIWAIHPGNDFLNSSTVITDIMNKYKRMYALGVRQFAVFVDDVAIPSTQAQYDLNAARVTSLQQAIEKEWNKSGAAPADTVKPLQFVPQIYCGSFAGGGEEQRKAFFTALSKTPSNVVIYTTGWGVWSVPNSSDVQSVRQYLGRDVAWWWNYPCNDNDADKLFTMDMYANFHDESRISNTATVDKSLKNCLAVLSNPMQQGEVSKIALFGVADYAWNNAAFNNKTNWNAAFPAIIRDKETAEAYQLLAAHLRYYDSGALSSLVNAYKTAFNKQGQADGSALKTTMQNILKAAEKIEALANSQNESDRLLLADLSPWLTKLHSMARQTLTLIEAAENAEESDKWNAYAQTINPLSRIDTDAAHQAPQLAGSVGAQLSLSSRQTNPSQETLRPFLSYLQEKSLGNLLGAPVSAVPVLFSNLEKAKGAVSKSKNSVTFVNNCVNTLQQGQYIGLSLPQPVKLESITAADSLFSAFTLLTSENGRDWSVLEKGSQPAAHVRYLVVENENPEPRSLKLARAVLKLTLPAPTAIASATIPSGDIYSGHNATFMTDGDYTTYTCLNRNQKTNDAYVVKLSAPVPVGDVRICMGTVNGDYMTVGRVQTSLDGKTWKTLRVKGTAQTDFRMTLPQVVKYSSEMSYCDFSGTNDTAQYVRLLVSTANTSKWLRLYDIEVNKATHAAKFKHPAADASGNALLSLTDKAGNTGIPATDTPSGNSLTYHFYDASPASSVVIFQAPGAPAQNAVVSAQTTNGEWVSLGTLTGGYQKISLAAAGTPSCIRISWEGNAAPVIYEIREDLTQGDAPIVSEIGSIAAPDAPLTVHTTEAGFVSVSSAEGITSCRVFTPLGKCLLTLRAGGAQQVQLPALSAGNQKVLILNIETAKGNTASCKLMLK